MPRLRVHNLSISLDGYAAGPAQDVEHPVGIGGHALHEWIFKTAYGQAMIGGSGGDKGIDDEFLRRGDEGIGATIMGRNMFGPVRGSWDSVPEEWRGWWGASPPYHHPVFVLTHHPREPLKMEGGTTFHFVDGDIATVLAQAFDAAGGADVRLGGGAATARAYLRAGLVDEIHVALVPVLLGGGERLFDEVTGYETADMVASPSVAHISLVRTPA
jgi:dihydrofolate reductase